MKKPRLHVTNHALLRYIERVEGRDIEALRAHLGRRLDRVADDHEGLSGIIAGGFRYVIHASAVTTVFSVHQPASGARPSPHSGEADDVDGPP